ncbi:hypothetical protein ACERZ8_07205 [Tateyamaria armeniaca]|uniref:Uncharacterized protein n=1 Tax=Tateyamaria armeniaca TaxID=2518930 RepID=A0ABW8USE1_9RHOB
MICTVHRNLAVPVAVSTGLFGGKFLGAAHWVGAIKRDTEGSHMQLQVTVCRLIKAVLWSLRGTFGKCERGAHAQGVCRVQGLKLGAAGMIASELSSRHAWGASNAVCINLEDLDTLILPCAAW